MENETGTNSPPEARADDDDEKAATAEQDDAESGTGETATETEKSASAPTDSESDAVGDKGTVTPSEGQSAGGKFDGAAPDALGVDKDPEKPETAPEASRQETEAQKEVRKTATPRKENGPEKPASGLRLSLQPDPPYTAYSIAAYQEQYEKNRRLQVMGKSMLAASFAMELIGAIIIESVEYGPTAWAAFGVIGTGIAHFIASAFMLGFSKPIHHLKPPKRDVARQEAAGDIIF
jgi:hypothetical protein